MSLFYNLVLNSGMSIEHINTLIMFIIQKKTGVSSFYNMMLNSGIPTKHINTLMYNIQLVKPYQHLPLVSHYFIL